MLFVRASHWANWNSPSSPHKAHWCGKTTYVGDLPQRFQDCRKKMMTFLMIFFIPSLNSGSIDMGLLLIDHSWHEGNKHLTGIHICRNRPWHIGSATERGCVGLRMIRIRFKQNRKTNRAGHCQNKTRERMAFCSKHLRCVLYKFFVISLWCIFRVLPRVGCKDPRQQRHFKYCSLKSCEAT